MTFLAGLLIVSVIGKQMIGEWFDSGIEFESRIDRQGRVLIDPIQEGVGQIGPVTDVNGVEPPDLKGKPVDSTTSAPFGGMETPLDWSYRNSGRFYVECINDSKPGTERWFYAPAQGRLFGYDAYYHQLLGSFGPDGFAPAGRQPGERFQGELRYRSSRWQAQVLEYLAFPGGVYTVDFARRTIRALFTPPAGEIVTFGRSISDSLDRNRRRVVVSTDRSFHFLTDEGSPVVAVPRVFDCAKYGYVPLVGLLESPERYFVWYRPWQHLLLEPEQFKTAHGQLLEYDAAGRELAHRTLPPVPFPAASYAKALFGLVTPMTEAATLVGASRYLRSEARLNGSTRKPVLLSYLENSKYDIPGTSTDEVTPGGLVPGYLALILLSAVVCALGCLLLARRYAFSRTRSIGWAVLGFLYGWVGLVLMLVLQEWPARVACPKCRKLRVVTRDTCEHCNALPASPAPDGTEIFESTIAVRHAALLGR